MHSDVFFAILNFENNAMIVVLISIFHHKYDILDNIWTEGTKYDMICASKGCS